MNPGFAIKGVLTSMTLVGLLGVGLGWHVVEDETCGFTVSMPTSPDASVDTTEAPIGSIVSRRYLAFDDVNSYTAACSTLPPSFFTAVDPVTFLHDGPDRFVAGNRGEVLFREPVTIDGHPGMRHAAQTGELYIYSEAYVVGDRLFQLSVSKWEEMGFNKDDKLDRFFASFELKP